MIDGMHTRMGTLRNALSLSHENNFAIRLQLRISENLEVVSRSLVPRRRVG
ncbi:hypothetical protein SAMD00023353_1002570 [Rosellinia necatrix]|uniref:Uncharacterized protein n=1 Tax=Rosellinia necatrix TaxID=77044 RepID=A0A1S8A6Q1_ROSNE|nr:hypothetical protein SAMD00023353_1002570 [Rosellinia necatrix]